MSAHHRTAEWFKFTRKVRPIIAATLPAPCVDCGWPVMPGSKWDVGHIIPAAMGGQDTLTNVGPSHSGKGRACNQKAGQKISVKVRNNRNETPKW